MNIFYIFILKSQNFLFICAIYKKKKINIQILLFNQNKNKNKKNMA